MYSPIKLVLAPHQEEKLKNAAHHNKSVSVKVNIDGKDDARHLFLLTHSQINQIKQYKMINR